MSIVNADKIRRLERIVVDDVSYDLYINIHRGIVRSAVIGQSPQGTYLPPKKLAEGVRTADALLGDTSDVGRWHAYPYCALIIRQEDGPLQVRTREHYLIALEGEVN